MPQKTKDPSLAKTGSDLTQFSLIGGVMFGVSIFLLYILYDLLALPYYVAVILSFGLGAAGHYFIARLLVFSDTTRSMPMGLAYFIIIVLADAALITVGTTLLVEYAGADVYWSRIGMGVVAGITNFYLNARFNFRVI